MSDPILDIRQVATGCKPDPFKFDIVSLEHFHGHTIVVANYGGETFGGNKLMVLRGIWEEPLSSLDPHFLNEAYPVFARFQPTKEGLRLARLVCANTPKVNDAYHHT